ncbi:MAG: Ig-like domain-containing protein [Lachnospiraceae bacterium]|nr:Ig-like domain-containing protein [Lachnospiraceae bacterium]
MDKKITLKCMSKLFGLVLVLVLAAICFKAPVAASAAEDEARLNVNEVAIAKDNTFRLRVYNVPRNARIIYRSSDVSVAFVDNRGYITGISNGECVVTATIVAGGSATDTLKCNVTVGPAAVSIKLTKTELVLLTGMKKTLKAIVSPLNTVEKPLFYSSDKEIASVTSIGRVRAKSMGEAVVYAFLVNGEAAECKIYVLSEEDYAKYLEAGSLEGIIDDNPSDDDPEDNEEGENNQEGDVTPTPSTEPTPEVEPTVTAAPEVTEK